LTEKQI